MAQVHALLAVSDHPFLFGPTFSPLSLPNPLSLSHIPLRSHGMFTPCRIEHLSFPMAASHAPAPFTLPCLPTQISLCVGSCGLIPLSGDAKGRCVPALQSRRYGGARSTVPWGNLQSTSCYYSLQQNNQCGLCNAVRWIEAA